jgi:UDP-N-acetylglucosamine--N-acetylmuramyl-(pentapeptide) pyrophosphoryl-undecaprenol N-acetylglucosamine transferase
LNNKSLVNHIDRILLNKEILKEMKLKAKKIGVPDSASRLYSLMQELVKTNHR